MEQVRWERTGMGLQGGGRLLTRGVAIMACLHIAGLVIPVLLPAAVLTQFVTAMGLSSAGLFGSGRLWQPFTYAAIYPSPCMAGLLVLLLLVLLFCGSRLERAWGTGRFLLFCAITSAASGMLRLLPEMDSGAVLVGSVGLLCALLAAFGHACRGQKIWLLLAPGPIGIPYFVIGALVIMLLFNLKPVANALWLSGAAFGLLYAELAGRAWRPLARRRRPSSDRFGEIDLDE